MKRKIVATAVLSLLCATQPATAADGGWLNTIGGYFRANNKVMPAADIETGTIFDVSSEFSPSYTFRTYAEVMAALQEVIPVIAVDHWGTFRDYGGVFFAPFVTMIGMAMGNSVYSLQTAAGSVYLASAFGAGAGLTILRHYSQQYAQVGLRKGRGWPEQVAKNGVWFISQTLNIGVPLLADMAGTAAAKSWLNNPSSTDNSTNAQFNQDLRRRNLLSANIKYNDLSASVGYNWGQINYLIDNLQYQEVDDGIIFNSPAVNMKDRSGNIVYIPAKTGKIPFGVENSSTRSLRVTDQGDTIIPATFEAPTRVESDSDRTWILSGTDSMQVIDGTLRKNQTLFYIPHDVRTTNTHEMIPIGGLVSDFHPGQIYMWGVNANMDIFKCRQPCNGGWEIVDGKADRVYVGQDWVGGTQRTEGGAPTVFVKTVRGDYFKRPEDGSSGWQGTSYYSIPLAARAKLGPSIPNNERTLKDVETSQTSTLYNCKIKPLSAKGTNLVLTENNAQGYDLQPDNSTAQQLFRIDWVASQNQNRGWADTVKIRSIFNTNSCVAPRGGNFGWPLGDVRQASNNTCRGDKELYWAVNFIGSEWANVWSGSDGANNYFSVRATQNQDRHWDMQGGGTAFAGQKLVQHGYNNDRNQQFWIYGCLNKAGTTTPFSEQSKWN